MSKLIVILLVSLTFEAIGVVYLARGLKQIGDVTVVKPAAILGVIKKGLTNKDILLGVFFEALFFAGLLTLMSKADVSFVWPLTSLGFLYTTIAARYILHEEVSFTRWSGVVLICAGAALITWSEKQKSLPQTKPAAVTESQAAP
ncbi:MAG: EamA family transporter [Verrucomicrobiota bacterium]